MMYRKSHCLPAILSTKQDSAELASTIINNYPAYGAFRYAGSLPNGQYGDEGTQQITSSYIWKRNPFVVPAKLKNFHQLCKQQEGSVKSNRLSLVRTFKSALTAQNVISML